VDPVPATLEGRAQMALLINCSGCHSAQVNAGNINVLDVPAMIQSGVIVAGSSATSPIYQAIQAGRMPLGGQIDSESAQTIAQWIDAGAKDFAAVTPPPAPPAKEITVGMTLAAIAADIQKVPAADRRFTRYVILTHVYRSDMLQVQKALFVKGVTKAINSVTWRSALSIPTPVDTDQTAVRFDIRKYDMSEGEWNLIVKNYPYEDQLKAGADFAALKQAMRTELPVVRGDWFIRTITQGNVYQELLDLPGNISRIEERIGVDAERNILNRRVVRAGLKDSGVSFSNRVVERHQSKFGAYYKSYDFETSRDDQNIFRNPLGPANLETRKLSDEAAFVHNGGEMIFTLPNGLHGYYLSDAAGNFLDPAPDTIVQDPTRKDLTVRNGTSCFTCHAAGWIPVSDEIRGRASRQRFSSRELELIRDLYPQPAATLEQFTSDIAAYTAVLAKLGITGGGEPVSAATLYYDQDMDAKAMAFELDITPQAMQDLLTSKESVRRELQIRRATSPVKRKAFERAFPKLLQIVKQI